MATIMKNAEKKAEKILKVEDYKRRMQSEISKTWQILGAQFIAGRIACEWGWSSLLYLFTIAPLKTPGSVLDNAHLNAAPTPLRSPQ